MTSCGALIRDYRERRRLTLREFAAMANVSHPFVYAVETGETLLPESKTREWENLLEIPSHSLGICLQTDKLERLLIECRRKVEDMRALLNQALDEKGDDR